MKRLPDELRLELARLRVCRANGITPRVLVPAAALDWLENVDVRGGRVDDIEDVRERVVAFARGFAGTPYDAHATIQTAPDTFSCSTLVKYAFAWVGIWMPRYAVDQSYIGRVVSRADAASGSLAFWKGEFPIRDEARVVGHVGLIVQDGRMLHASSKSRDVHEFTPLRPDTALYVDPFPPGPHALIGLPSEQRGLETALDIVRWMQR